MTIPTWATPFSDNTSTIGATFLNDYVRTQLPKCLDGVGGSDGIPSTPTTKLQIYGLGLELGGVTAPRLKYESRSITRAQTGWRYNATGNTWDFGSVNVSPTNIAVQELDRVPDGSTLTAVTVYHDRVDAGLMPTTRVSAEVKKRNIVTGVVASIGSSTQDPTNTITPYQAHHGFSISGLSEVIDRDTTVYYVEFTGEDGSNTLATSWNGCTCTFTVTEQDEAP